MSLLWRWSHTLMAVEDCLKNEGLMGFFVQKKGETELNVPKRGVIDKQ
jgi:hypothetical protein